MFKTQASLSTRTSTTLRYKFQYILVLDYSQVCVCCVVVCVCVCVCVPEAHKAIATYCLLRKYFQTQTQFRTYDTPHSHDALIIDALIAGRRFLPRQGVTLINNHIATRPQSPHTHTTVHSLHQGCPDLWFRNQIWFLGPKFL